MFVNDFSDNPKLSYVTTNFQAKIDSEFQRLLAREILKKLGSEINGLSLSDPSYIEKILEEFSKKGEILKSFLYTLSKTLENTPELDSSTNNTYKSNVNIALSNIISSISEISNIIQKIDTQKI